MKSIWKTGMPVLALSAVSLAWQAHTVHAGTPPDASIRPFRALPAVAQDGAEAQRSAAGVMRYAYDRSVYDQLRQAENVTIDVATSPTEQVQLKLTTRSVDGAIAKAARVRASTDDPHSHTGSRLVLARGHLVGDPGAPAFIAFAPNFAVGFVTAGQRFLEFHPRLREDSTYEIELVDNATQPQQVCGVCDERIDGLHTAIPSSAVPEIARSSGGVLRTISIGWQSDSDLTDNFATTDDLIDFVDGLFASVSEITRRDVAVIVEPVFAWAYTPAAPADWEPLGYMCPDLHEFNPSLHPPGRTVAVHWRLLSSGGGCAVTPAVCVQTGYNAKAQSGASIAVIAHEFGHTIAANHTWNYDPPITECTLMSYCGPKTYGYHPVVQQHIWTFLDSIQQCDTAKYSVQTLTHWDYDGNGLPAMADLDACLACAEWQYDSLGCLNVFDEDADGAMTHCDYDIFYESLWGFPSPTPDCNGNSLKDKCEIDLGLTEDCDGDYIPDECEYAWEDCDDDGIRDQCEADADDSGYPDDCEPPQPAVVATGSRYMSIQMPAWTSPVALRVDPSCGGPTLGYVQPSGTLGASPYYSSSWGSMDVRDANISPRATFLTEYQYDVRAESTDGFFSYPATPGYTWVYGDVNNDGSANQTDIDLVIAAFQQPPADIRPFDVELEVPNGTIDFRDISGVANAVNSVPYPYTMICP